MKAAHDIQLEQLPTKARQFAKVCEILDRYGRDKARLIPILQEVQDEYRYLPEEVHGLMTPEKALKAVDDILAQEGAQK